ncbi:hypothetical protein Pmani_027535 [Petrolisthes manimaculis]|uniref:Uncharacterized protein n=1 Tax=Petrolisthes manimaculis TaxID=1843537 RepID=A0AAE1P3W5_9EUCA|nr:hypothetical protein Pmani_027535 [Petrolisthes manimaculis]
MKAGIEYYVNTMDALVGGDRSFLKMVHMEAEHNKAKDNATQVYLEKNIYGRKNQAVAEKYQTLLHEQIEKLYLQYSQNNEAKEITHMARTPGTLFVVFSSST